jgi:AcrR family transcriptional regulator
MQLFWVKGYEGTSLTDLTKAMGISRPSLYAAFGNKEALFKKAFARYGEGPASVGRTARELPTARAAVEKLLYEAADALAHPSIRDVFLSQAASWGVRSRKASAGSCAQHAARA